MVMDSSVIGRDELFAALEDFCSSAPRYSRISAGSKISKHGGCETVFTPAAEAEHIRRVEMQMMRAANCTMDAAKTASYEYYLLVLVAGAKALHQSRQA